MTLLQSGITKSLAADAYTIDQSLRFNNPDAAYLTRTPTGSGNRTTWTFSCWLKRGNNADQREFGISGWDSSGSNPRTFLGFDTSDRLYLTWNPTGTTGENVITSMQFRDFGAWYHIVTAIDTTQTTNTDRVKFYVNGEQVTDFDTYSTITEDSESPVNQAGMPNDVGNYTASHVDDLSYDGYLAEVYHIDGLQLAASDFGETDEDTNQWKPIDASGLTFGTNGFYLKFQDSAALGDDSSGNTNDFTVTNLVATDQMKDSPTNNFCTLNPLIRPAGAVAYQEGNLRADPTAAWDAIAGTMGVSSGKWYWEQVTVDQYYSTVGIVGDTADLWFSSGTNPQNGNGFLLYVYNGTKEYDGGSSSGYGATFTSDDIIGVALNMDDREVTFYKNNATQGAISFSGYEIDNANLVMPAANLVGGSPNPINEYYFNAGQDSSFAGNFTAQGNQDGNGIGDFYYEPPTDFLALCSSNLSDPEIALPGENFNTVLWTGDGTDGRQISGVGFNPDLIWAKVRNSGSVNHALFTSVGGGTNVLNSDTSYSYNNGASVSAHGSIDSFTVPSDDGFTVGDGDSGTYPRLYVNDSSVFGGAAGTYVAWNWLGANGTVTNTDGTNIVSTVSANTTAGFSICTYTGTGTDLDSFGHGLTQKPELVIVKNLDSSAAWIVGSQELTSSSYIIVFNGDGAEYTSTNKFSEEAPTASVVILGDADETNKDTESFISYCFHSVEGYSKVASYAGNDNADGTFIYLGFKPAFAFVKATSSGGANRDWTLWDSVRSPYNQIEAALQPNTVDAEQTGTSGRGLPIDFLSNGIKLRASDGEINYAPVDYMIYAVAESPFKTSNAR